MRYFHLHNTLWGVVCLLFLFNFYWNIGEFKCSVSFRSSAKWSSYVYTYIYLFRGIPGGSDGKESACNAANPRLFFYYRLLQDTEHGSQGQTSSINLNFALTVLTNQLPLFFHVLSNLATICIYETYLYLFTWSTHICIFVSLITLSVFYISIFASTASQVAQW